MIAPLELTKGMPLSPNACVLCANNPVDFAGNQQEAVFAPGVDVNWGDSVYICDSCCQIIADLKGRVTTEGFDTLSEKYDRLKGAYEKLERKHEKAKALLERIAEGKKAVAEVKKGKVTA